MTDKELIRALRCCTSRPDCDKCAEECVFYKGNDVEGCVPDMGITVSNRLEALLAENERLKTQVPQWKPGSEPPPKNGVYIVRIKDATKVTTLNCNVNSENGKYSWFTQNDFYFYDVTHWMPLPELPKMEDTP